MMLSGAQYVFCLFNQPRVATLLYLWVGLRFRKGKGGFRLSLLILYRAKSKWQQTRGVEAAGINAQAPSQRWRVKAVPWRSECDGWHEGGGAWRKSRVPIRSPLFLTGWERWRGREAITTPPTHTASDSVARMNPLMTTFIQIRLIVIMVNN